MTDVIRVYEPKNVITVVNAETNVVRVISPSTNVVRVVTEGPQGQAGPPGQDGVQSIVAGSNVTVDNTDPQNPIVSASFVDAVPSVFGRTGAITAQSGDYTKAQVGLGNVDNTSDANKPVSTAQGAADAAVQAYAVQRANHTGTQLASTISDFAATVRATVLTGYALGSNAVLAATDTILEAFGKLQAQINAKLTANAPVVGATKTKITYDANGLVTSGADADIADVTGLQAALDGKVDENAAIVGATKTKVTYDSKGLVTSGADAAIADITGLQTALDGKVDENTAITGSTKTKISYDAKGLVTAGVDATTADIADSSNKRYVTDAQLTVIGNTSGTNTGDQNLFGTIAVAGQSDVVADSTSDTLTIVAGTNITITTNAGADSVTINAASGGGNSVLVSCDFGASFTDKAQTVVTGEAWVTATSNISAQVITPIGVDPDEMYLLDLKPVISERVLGVGFTVTLYSRPEAKGIYEVMCTGV